MWKKWLFDATDFQSLMYPCFTFCRILGIFPYKLNSSIFEISKRHYILSSVFICIWCICNGIIIHDLISKTDIIGINRILEIVCFYTFSCLVMIITHILSGPRMRLLQTILKVSSKLPPKSYHKLSRLIHVKDILSTIIVVVQTGVSLPKSKFLYHQTPLGMIFTVYCILLIFQLNTLYINCVYVLKACFKNINDNLTHTQRLVVNDIKSCVPTLINHIQNNQFLLIKLKTMKKWHLMVSDTMQILNVIFSPQILAIIVIIFSNTTFELYFYIVRWQNGISIIVDKKFLTVIFMVTSYHAILIIMLVWACETSKNQAQKIRTTIHDLLNHTINKEIRDELHLFSLQVLHCENTFSTKGLTVDATLLAAMVGSITTYMLILMQFMITLHSCDEVINNT